MCIKQICICNKRKIECDIKDTEFLLKQIIYTEMIMCTYIAGDVVGIGWSRRRRVVGIYLSHMKCETKTKVNEMNYRIGMMDVVIWYIYWYILDSCNGDKLIFCKLCTHMVHGLNNKMPLEL